MRKDGILRRAVGLLLILTVICGFLYMPAVTGLAQLLFPYEANGSIIEIDGKAYGSQLLGQEFRDASHLWGRVMNVDTVTYKDENGRAVMYASPSNLSPAGEKYEKLVAERVAQIKAANPDAKMETIPVELVTCSGSGLDPEISPAAAEYQVPRIAENTDYTEDEVREIIERYTTGRFLGIFGEPRVNVLEVNLALEGIL